MVFSNLRNLRNLRIEDLREFRPPVEGVYPPHLLVVGDELPVEVVGADERVAALDVVRQVGQGALVEHARLPLQRLAAFALQDLQQ